MIPFTYAIAALDFLVVAAVTAVGVFAVTPMFKVV